MEKRVGELEDEQELSNVTTERKKSELSLGALGVIPKV